jgi:hypothetical protein
MFVRMQWLETRGRYERIFSVKPPTMIAFFSERVPLCKGEWKPEGDTATAYVWLVWLKGREPQAPFWIPPDCRTDLEHPADVTRFTSKPVMTERRVVHFIAGDFVDVETGEIIPAGVTAHSVDTTKATGASSRDIAENEAECRTPASSESAIAAPDTHPAVVADSTISDPDIPEFLRRNADNSVPSVPVASPREAQSGISGEAGG